MAKVNDLYVCCKGNMDLGDVAACRKAFKEFIDGPEFEGCIRNLDLSSAHLAEVPVPRGIGGELGCKVTDKGWECGGGIRF